MAIPVTAYKSDDGQIYASEIEALRADALYWKNEAFNQKVRPITGACEISPSLIGEPQSPWVHD